MLGGEHAEDSQAPGQPSSFGHASISDGQASIADSGMGGSARRSVDDPSKVFVYDGTSIFPAVRLSSSPDGENLVVQILERRISIRPEHLYPTAEEALTAGQTLGCRVRGLFVLCGSDGWEGWDVFGEMICGSYDDAHKVCIEENERRHRRHKLKVLPADSGDLLLGKESQSLRTAVGTIRAFNSHTDTDICCQIVRKSLQQFDLPAGAICAEIRQYAREEGRGAEERGEGGGGGKWGRFWVREVRNDKSERFVVGMIALAEIVSPEHPGFDGVSRAAELKHFFVRPDLTATGHGLALYRYASAVAVLARFERVFLQTSRRFTQAARFYARNGFVLHKRTETAWEVNLMQLHLLMQQSRAMFAAMPSVVTWMPQPIASHEPQQQRETLHCDTSDPSSS